MAGDWIKLHRKSLDSRVFSDPTLWRLWTWMLLRANYRPRFFKGHRIEAGSLAIGTRSAGEALGLSHSSVFRSLKRLAEWEMITLDAKRDYTIVTICNYKTYQARRKRPRNANETPAKHPRNADETLALPREEPKEPKEVKETPLPPIAIDLPPVLDSPEFRSALDDWRAYKGRAYSPRGLKGLVSQAAKRATSHGLPAVINAFEMAVSNGWKGWNFDGSFEAKRNGRRNDIGPGQRHDPAAAQGASVEGW